MLARFMKPKWKHKNPEIRRAAVERLVDQETLLEIINSDPDEQTRNTAIGRIDNIASLLAVHTDPRIQVTLNQRLIELLPDAIETNSEQGEAIANYVRVRGGPSLATEIALTNPSVALRIWVIPLLNDSATLEKMAAIDSNPNVRLQAAQQLQDPAAIHRTLKQLGRKDKRVTQLLKQKLEEQQQRQQRQQEIERVITEANALGSSEHWQRDHTRLLSLKNRWPSLTEHCNSEQQTRFETACSDAETKIQERREAAEAQKPVIEQKSAQCQLIEDFVAHLEQRHRISAPKANEVQSTLDTLLSDWNEIDILPEAMEIPLANRFHAQLSQARKLVETLKDNARSTRDLENIIGRAEILLGKKRLREADVHKLQHQWDKQPTPNDKALATEYREHFSRLLNQLTHRISKQNQLRDQGLEKIEGYLQRIRHHLEKDRLGDSIELEQQVRQLLDRICDIPPPQLHAIQQQLKEFTPRIRELNGWRHWGTDRVREELIEEAEQLCNAPQSPQERAKAVSMLRSRWKQLVTIDHHANRHLWKQFDKACNAAYELCKQHQKAETARRQQNLQLRGEICDQLEELGEKTDWNAPDWRLTDRQFQQLRNQWNKAGPVDRADWQKIHKRYRHGIAAIEQHLKHERELNYNLRLGLCEQLEGLIDSDDLSAALATVREAQRAWKPTISSKRSLEQKLWKRFKAAGDAIYSREKSRINSETTKLNSLLAQKTAVCEQIEELADHPEKAGQRLQALITEWREIELPGNKHSINLEQRFQHALQSIDFAKERQQLEQLRDAIEDRHNQFMLQEHGTTDTSPDEVLLDLEILLELPSPPELENMRLERKVAKLSARLNERQETDTLQQATQQLQELYQSTAPSQLSPLSMDRIMTVRDAITGELTRKIEELRQS